MIRCAYYISEHRECMLHLVTNFKKRYTGEVFEDHLWAAAYSWSPYIFEKNWSAMDEANPEAMDYIRKHHNKIWTRSQFWTHCKVDYVTNNLAECFNNWVKKKKKNVAPSCESSILPVDSTIKTMHFPPRYDLHTYILIFCNTFSFNSNLTYLYYYSRSASVTLGSGNSVLI